MLHLGWNYFSDNWLSIILIFFIQHLGSSVTVAIYIISGASVIHNYLSCSFHIIASCTWAQECSRLALARSRTYTRRHARSTHPPTIRFAGSCSVHRDPVSHGNMSSIYSLNTRVVDPVRISPPVSHASNTVEVNRLNVRLFTEITVSLPWESLKWKYRGNVFNTARANTIATGEIYWFKGEY